MPKVMAEPRAAEVKQDDFRAKLREDYPNLQEFFPFLDQLNKESPRGSVLIASSFIEEQLRRVILAFLIESSEANKLLEGYYAPLGSFSARASAAFCLGLISSAEYEDCDTIRRIRNEFAHIVSASFDDQRIEALCRKLHLSAKDYGDVVVGSFGQFTTASVALIMNLTNRAHYVGKDRLSYRKWPH